MKKRRRIGLRAKTTTIGILVVCLAFVVAGFLVEVSTAQAQMYVYPAQGQTKEQQDKDEYDCHQWAVQQTGFDPTKQTAPSGTAEQSSGGAVRGAARGAALGAVGGAIAGDAGKGAAAGAAVGGAGGRMRQNQRNREAQEQAQQQQQAYQNTMDDYNRAKATCLQGRGYSVTQ
jgi:hypothetical protein